MAEVAERPDSQLYESDFTLWLDRQIGLLRASRFQELDLEHLIEEMESLGRKERQEVESRVLLVLVHLLKLAFSPAPDPRRGWLRTTTIQRRTLDRMLTRSLRNHLTAQLVSLYDDARRLAAIEMETDSIEPGLLPRECPFTLDEILDHGWLPQNVHDLDRDEV